jgi:hypothetical protein
MVWFGSNIFNVNAKGHALDNDAQGYITNSNNGNGIQIHLDWDDIKISDIHQDESLTLYVEPSGSKLVRI